MCKGKGVYVGRMGEWCIGCVGEGEGPEGSVCGEDGGMVCVCLVNLGSPHCCAWLDWWMPIDGFVPSALHCLTVFPLYR